jgi:anti-sigma regulatory factor (Ser/Thr protein kinase)
MPKAVTHQHGFHHEAVLYAGEDDFAARLLPFIRDGVARDEPVMVATSAGRIERLRSGLNGESDSVRFVDMAELGRNPARIIPAWREFAEAGEGRPQRGIGEPIWAGRTDAEVSECHHHESLLNLAFAEGPELSLLCPYDVDALPAEVIECARRTHPFVDEGGSIASEEYLPPDTAPSPFSGPLSPVPESAPTRRFDLEQLEAVRSFITAWAEEQGLDRRHAQDLMLAMHELTANSVRHGGGRGTVRVWRDGDAVVGEVSDRGRLRTSPLVGRAMPDDTTQGGRGLWIVNQLCDLVQIRSLPRGNVVRVRLEAEARTA